VWAVNIIRHKCVKEIFELSRNSSTVCTLIKYVLSKTNHKLKGHSFSFYLEIDRTLIWYDNLRGALSMAMKLVMDMNLVSAGFMISQYHFHPSVLVFVLVVPSAYHGLSQIQLHYCRITNYEYDICRVGENLFRMLHQCSAWRGSNGSLRTCVLTVQPTKML